MRTASPFTLTALDKGASVPIWIQKRKANNEVLAPLVASLGGEMPEPDRYAMIYLNFEDHQARLDDMLSNMRFIEYREFVEYCFKELDFAAEAKDGGEFRRVRGLILAIARKQLEISKFMDGLTDSQRASAWQCAVSYYELAKGFYDADKVPALEAAWAASIDHCERFGWPSVVFDVLAPHKIFK
jgi:hypothetical protein